MKQTIYFTGTLPSKGKIPFGGGEVGNVRTIRMLESLGYRVVPVRRIVSSSSVKSLSKYFTFPLRTLLNAIQWFFVLLFGSRKNSIAHVSGFYGPSIPIEIIQVFMAKFFGYKLVYELRGGGAILFYQKGTERYKKQFRYILNTADYLFTQGQENESLIKQLCNKPIFYYPNCVQKEFYLDEISPKPNNTINLIFFGRIEQTKNPLLIVDATSLLQQKYKNITLTIIGNGEKELIEKVRDEMHDKLSYGSYHLISGCQHHELQSKLLDKHFYIFPSEQPREGQSNAVTEAMSFGIIPIASPQGFNHSTIGTDELIVEELTAKAYASLVCRIIEEDKIEYYSKFVRDRFMNNYTEKVVFERAKEVYKMIFKEKGV